MWQDRKNTENKLHKVSEEIKRRTAASGWQPTKAEGMKIPSLTACSLLNMENTKKGKGEKRE